jgi:hypothetical protein
MSTNPGSRNGYFEKIVEKAVTAAKKSRTIKKNQSQTSGTAIMPKLTSGDKKRTILSFFISYKVVFLHNILLLTIL